MWPSQRAQPYPGDDGGHDRHRRKLELAPQLRQEPVGPGPVRTGREELDHLGQEVHLPAPESLTNEDKRG